MVDMQKIKDAIKRFVSKDKPEEENRNIVTDYVDKKLEVKELALKKEQIKERKIKIDKILAAYRHKAQRAVWGAKQPGSKITRNIRDNNRVRAVRAAVVKAAVRRSVVQERPSLLRGSSLMNRQGVLMRGQGNYIPSSRLKTGLFSRRKI